MAKLEKLAQWPQREHHDATDGRREGIEECFTINRLDVQPSLHRCLAKHEFDRESSFGSSSWDPARLRVDGQTDGKTLVSCGHVSYGKELPPSDGAH